MEIVSEIFPLLYDADRDVNGAGEHLLDLERGHNRLEMAPRAREALERAGRAERGVPHQQIQRHRADRRPFEPGRDDPRARLEMADDVGERLWRAHYVVREMKPRRVGRHRYRGFLDRGRDERDVLPAIVGSSRAGPLEHLGALLNSDDRALRPDETLQRRKTQPGAAADIEDSVAILQTQQLDGALPHGFE